MPTQATDSPCRRAASAKRIGNRPLPASRPIGSVRPARAGRLDRFRRQSRSRRITPTLIATEPSAVRLARSLAVD